MIISIRNFPLTCIYAQSWCLTILSCYTLWSSFPFISSWTLWSRLSRSTLSTGYTILTLRSLRTLWTNCTIFTWNTLWTLWANCTIFTRHTLRTLWSNCTIFTRHTLRTLWSLGSNWTSLATHTHFLTLCISKPLPIQLPIVHTTILSNTDFRAMTICTIASHLNGDYLFI